MSADKNFRVGVYSFSGNPDIYVTSETDHLDNLDRFEYKGTEPTDDVLVITPEDRKKNGVTKGWYHICVVGHSTTSYRLRVVESNDNFFLEDGIAETNEVKSGKDLTVYYTDSALARDLNLTFTLSPHSGPTPQMYIKFCGTVNEEQCHIRNKKASDVHRSVKEHGEIYSFIKHHGRDCSSRESIKTKPCLYAIQVSLPESRYEKVSHFSLVGHHNETSHIKLREGVSMENVLESHQYKYFKFVNRDSDVTNVTFTVKSHHGDADLYISKSDKYPNEEHFDRKSDLSSRFADEVIFSLDKKTKSLLGTYYVGVRGFEYTSYSIRASLTRKGEKGDDDDDDDDVGPKEIVPIQLREGVTHNEFLHGKTKKYFKFKTSMRGDAISDIRITFTASSGKYQYFIKSGSMPTKNKYDYASFDGSDIIMKKDDKKFKATGTKYILVVPNTKLEKFPKRGRFSLKYTAGHSLQPIVKGMPVQGTVKIGEYDYFRYHSLEEAQDLTVSLTPQSGEPKLVVSTDPQNMYPTLKNNTFHSLRGGRDSIAMKGRDLFKGISTCNPIKAMSTGDAPCEIFIGVYCKDSTDSHESRKNDMCSFSLKIYSMNDTVHLLHSGTPQKDEVKKNQVMTYYMPLDTTKDDLYIQASAQHGDIKIYASFADHSLKHSEIVSPTKEESVMTGKDVGNSQMVHFTKKDVRKDCEEFIECMVVISVEGLGDKDTLNEYIITSYYHLRKLIHNSPSFTVIEAETMAYFTYKSYCDDCTIYLSAIPFAIDADIDMYLNIGAKKDLPTAESYDIKRDEWFTEHVELDTNHEYYERNKIKNMQDTIIVGIYAKETTLVDVYAEESKTQTRTLNPGKGIQVKQRDDKKLFKYTHKGDSSIKFELIAMHGELNMRVNCYDPVKLDRPMNAYIPENDSSSKWRLSSKEGESGLIIESTDENFCADGIYLIAIDSDSRGAKYTLGVHTDKTFTFKHMKIGVPVKDTLSDEQQKKYSFVLDKKKPLRIASSVIFGKLRFDVSETKDFKKVLSSSDDGHIVIDSSDIKKFKTGKNIYIRVVGELDYTEFILVATHDDSYSIIPDGHTMMYTMDPNEPKGINLMYYPPSVDISMRIQVDGFDHGVAFVVSKKSEFLYQIKKGKLEFPTFQGGEEGMSTSYATEGNRYTELVQHSPTRDDPYVWLFNISPVVFDDDENLGAREKAKTKEEVKVAVHISVSEMNILSQNIPTEMIYTRPDVGEYSYFKFFANGNKDIEVALSPCVCQSEMSIFKSFENSIQDHDVLHMSHELENGLKKIHIPQASGPYFIKVKKSSDPEWEQFRYAGIPCVFEIVYYELKHPNFQFYTGNIFPENDGMIDFDWPSSSKLHLKWGSIMKEGKTSSVKFPAFGALYAFKEKSIFMNSVCGFKYHLALIEKPLFQLDNVKEEETTIDVSKHKALRNEKYATFYYLASVNRKGGNILFKPLTVVISVGWFAGVPWFLIFVVILIIGALGFGVYYYRNRVEEIEEKHNFEMNDVRGFSHVPAKDQYGV